MKTKSQKCRPGQVRDAIVRVLEASSQPLSAKEIEDGVGNLLDSAAASSVRSYLSLNTPDLFVRASRGVYRLHLDHVLGLQPELPQSEGSPSRAALRVCQ